MSIDIEATAADLRHDPLVDRGRLKSGGRKEVLGEIQQLERERGLRAHIVLLPAGASPAEAKPLWDALNLDHQRDLLLISNGKDWEVRGWGLSSQQIAAAMAQSAPAYKQYFGKGVVQSLTALAAVASSPANALTPPSPSPPRPKPEVEAKTPVSSGGATSTLSNASTAAKTQRGSRLPLGLGLVGAVVVGGIGFAMYRRNKRAAETRNAFNSATHNAESTYTALILAAEELGGDLGSQLQLKASDLKNRLDAIIVEAGGAPDKMGDRVVLGKIAQIDSELAALRSTQLQKAKP